MDFTYIISFGIFAALVILVLNKITKKKQPAHQLDADTIKKILKDKIGFYSSLEKEEKEIFIDRIIWFLEHIRIEGIETSLTDEDRILVASSAVIPFFHLPQYNYGDLHEVFVYGNNFSPDFEVSEDQHIMGTVHSGGIKNNTMLISKPALHRGFEHEKDQKNVGFHEFAHLLDKADGSIDGVPSLFLPDEKIDPWTKLIDSEQRRIKAGNSDINAYAATNNAEFFAVLSEYFHENPTKLKKRHPDLFRMMEIIYH